MTGRIKLAAWYIGNFLLKCFFEEKVTVLTFRQIYPDKHTPIGFCPADIFRHTGIKHRNHFISERLVKVYDLLDMSREKVTVKISGNSFLSYAFSSYIDLLRPGVHICYDIFASYDIGYSQSRTEQFGKRTDSYYCLFVSENFSGDRT